MEKACVPRNSTSPRIRRSMKDFRATAGRQVLCNRSQANLACFVQAWPGRTRISSMGSAYRMAGAGGGAAPRLPLPAEAGGKGSRVGRAAVMLALALLTPRPALAAAE